MNSNADQTAVVGGTEGFGVGTDCVFGGTLAADTATGCLMTTAWEVNAAYEHYWTPQWHHMLTSITGCGSAPGVGD